MRKIILLFLIISHNTFADTIDHYMDIANNIPQMEIKADQQSQAWARSARTILTLTSESITETLSLLNETASQQGSPLFCLPSGVQLNAGQVNDIIQQTYRSIPSQQSDKNKLSVSQVALMGIKKQYPCPQHPVTNTNNQTAPTNPWGNING